MGEVSDPGELRRVLLGTRSAGKLREFAGLLAPLHLELCDLEQAGVAHAAAEDGVESHPTFEENALAKARYFYLAGGGLPTIADDSGLSVAALGGAPGVHSRRWSGVRGAEEDVAAANNRKLLDSLRGVSEREATFSCALAFVSATRTVVVRGDVYGRVTDSPRGGNGFGYDPLFAPEEARGATYAELSDPMKARLSHRARAAAALVRALRGEADPGHG